MIMDLFQSVMETTGNTPCIKLGEHIYAKLEGCNLFGSTKDRMVFRVIKQLLEKKVIDNNTTIIESSSGNTAIALAGVCGLASLRFVCVTDPLMSMSNREILASMGAEIITVYEHDENNIYVAGRIHAIKEYMHTHTNTFWFNQYDNPLICGAYDELGEELISQTPNLKRIFIPISSGGLTLGLSSFLLRKQIDIKLIVVDLDSSSIFQKSCTRQHISGMGFPEKPGNIRNVSVDDFVIVNERRGIEKCLEFAQKGLLIGASSGCVLAGLDKYLCQHPNLEGDSVAIFPDRGERYIKTIYNREWLKKLEWEHDLPNYKEDIN